MTPTWLALLQALGILIVVGLAGFIAIATGFASFLLFMVFVIPRFIDSLTDAVEFISRTWEWTRLHRRSVMVTAVTSVVVVMLGIWQWYFYWDTSDIPDSKELIVYAPPQVGFVYDRNGKTLIELAIVYRKPMDYPQVPLVMEQATIAFEDRQFYEHNGIDWLALPVRLLSGKGGSTVTMQLARNHYLHEMLLCENSDRLCTDNVFTRLFARRFGVPWTNTRTRKLREIKYALHLEKQTRAYARTIIDARMTTVGFWWPQRWWQSRIEAKRLAKELLLARYLTTRYYGNSMYDPESAARFYFNKGADDLTVDEAALLASFAPAPSRYAVIADSQEVRAQQKGRRDRVLEAMGEVGFLATAYDCGTSKKSFDRLRWLLSSELPRGDCIDDVAKYQRRPVSLIGRVPGGRTEAPATVQMAFDELEERGFSDRSLFDGAVRLHTTTDIRLQRAVNRAAEAGLTAFRRHYPEQKGIPQVAIAVLRNSDGAVLAQYGGNTNGGSNNWTHLDRSRKSWRQPGSAFKVFVYLAAFLRHPELSPDSIVMDDYFLVRMGGGSYKSIQNYDGINKGPLPLREAMAQSRNVPAMKIGMEWAGLDLVIETAHTAGITTKLKHEPSIILGSNDLTVMEMANGFRTIVSGGITAQPYLVDHITNPLGARLVTHEPVIGVLPATAQAIDSVRELLRGNVRMPSGTAHALYAPLQDVPLMCKTGTSNDYADARISCGTWGPEGITMHAWMGWDDARRPLGDRATGGRLALPIARVIMEAAYVGNPRAGEPAILGAAPQTPPELEARIEAFVQKHYPSPDSK